MNIKLLLLFLGFASCVSVPKQGTSYDYNKEENDTLKREPLYTQAHFHNPEQFGKCVESVLNTAKEFAIFVCDSKKKPEKEYNICEKEHFNNQYQSLIKGCYTTTIKRSSGLDLVKSWENL